MRPTRLVHTCKEPTNTGKTRLLHPRSPQIHRLWFTDSGSNVLSISGSNLDLRGRLIEGWMQSPLNNKVARLDMRYIVPRVRFVSVL